MKKFFAGKKNSLMSIRELFDGKYFAMCRWALSIDFKQPWNNFHIIFNSFSFLGFFPRQKTSEAKKPKWRQRRFFCPPWNFCSHFLLPLFCPLCFSRRRKLWQTEFLLFSANLSEPFSSSTSASTCSETTRSERPCSCLLWYKCLSAQRCIIRKVLPNIQDVLHIFGALLGTKVLAISFQYLSPQQVFMWLLSLLVFSFFKDLFPPRTISLSNDHTKEKTEKGRKTEL